MFNWIEKLFRVIWQSIVGLYEIRRGLRTVAMHAFRPPTTEVYPDIVPALPAHFRGRLALTVSPETGEHLCISCRQCERVCPDKCIEITAHKSPETNKLELIDFKIDHGLCMFCGLCTEVCPTYCIINTNDFEMADYTREGLIYDLKKLTLTQEESAFYFDRKENPLPKPKPAKPAAPAAKPAAPGAAAAGAAKAAVADKPVGEAGASGQTVQTKPAGEGESAKESEAKPQDAPGAAEAPAPKSSEEAKPGDEKPEEPGQG